MGGGSWKFQDASIPRIPLDIKTSSLAFSLIQCTSVLIQTRKTFIDLRKLFKIPGTVFPLFFTPTSVSKRSKIGLEIGPSWTIVCSFGVGLVSPAVVPPTITFSIAFFFPTILLSGILVFPALPSRILEPREPSMPESGTTSFASPRILGLKLIFI